MTLVASAGDVLLRWACMHPVAIRVLAFLIVVAGLVLMASAPARADDLTDSHGIPADRYAVLPYDRGDLFNLDKFANSWWISGAWDANNFLLTNCIWLFRWTLSFQWVEIVAAPGRLLGVGLERIIGELNIIPIALVIAAIVCGLAIVRGKYASGLLNILISVLFAVAVAAGGVLHNPVESVVGEQGALHYAAQVGGELAVRITTDGELPDGSTDDLSRMIDDSVSEQLVDIFLRTPAQLVSFGTVLDDECTAVFDEKMKGVKTGDAGDTSVRDAVAACDPRADQFVKFPTGQLTTLWVVGSAMFCLFALAIALVLVLFWTMIMAAYKALSLIVTGIIAILPTANRANVWYTAFDVLTALAMVAVSIVFLAAYLRFVIMYMTMTAFAGVGQYLIVDALFIGGVVLVFRIRGGLTRAGKSMAERMTRLGLGTSTASRDGSPISAIHVAASVGRTLAHLKAPHVRIPRSDRPATAAGGKKTGSTKSERKSSATTRANDRSATSRARPRPDRSERNKVLRAEITSAKAHIARSKR